MKLKKLNVRKKSISPNMDTLEDFHDDDACSTDSKGIPIQRNTANARERARMRVLSSAFYRLKTIIPWVPHDTKLSKLDTLRLARNYISYLSATLAGESVNDISNKMPHPQKMTWPYIFQQVPELVADLNSSKVSNSSSRKENNSSKKSTEMMTLIESPQKFTPHEHPQQHQESHLRSISQFYRCHNDDFEMVYE